MNRKILALAGALIGIAVGFGIAAHPADANQTPAFQTQAAPPCTMPTGWHVNDDEQARKPTPVLGGLKFGPASLVHHAADLSLTDLHPGTYAAYPAPDQSSFFSVELRDPNGAYGTLRWDTATSKWNITTSGPAAGQFSFTNPADVVGTVTKWGTFTEATKVVSFGVGYTLNPPGTVTTVVAFVHFGGHTFDLRCKPVRVTHSPTPTATVVTPTTPQSSPAHSPSQSQTATPGALAITGPNLPMMIGIGLIVVLLGLLAVFAAQRRKTHFRP